MHDRTRWAFINKLSPVGMPMRRFRMPAVIVRHVTLPQVRVPLTSFCRTRTAISQTQQRLGNRRGRMLGGRSASGIFHGSPLMVNRDNRLREASLLMRRGTRLGARRSVLVVRLEQTTKLSGQLQRRVVILLANDDCRTTRFQEFRIAKLMIVGGYRQWKQYRCFSRRCDFRQSDSAGTTDDQRRRLKSSGHVVDECANLSRNAGLGVNLSDTVNVVDSGLMHDLQVAAAEIRIRQRIQYDRIQPLSALASTQDQHAGRCLSVYCRWTGGTFIISKTATQRYADLQKWSSPVAAPL